MSDQRKKFTLYLHPDNDADRQALEVIESVARLGRGELFRNAFIAGIALHHLDSRLPVLLSTLFRADLKPDQLVGLIGQTTGWKPSQADIRMILEELGAGKVSPLPEDAPKKESDELEGVRKKLKNFV
ncbi:TPA: plasmid stability protein [Enterobacter hormaechei subsp. steigerwaltii]|nr:plasmid stability protein [Enterobacter hormaechei subsp. steigerwaltii]